ncbi:Similar to tRNA pseudouridine synthase C, group TruC1 [hydrothermal vent metagenome]|uniref:Similar to tRNA pseudouridine synthase C, group TruC1 n=1 Tax=hydrothermal vent metagenome TaxID=652676 RepID=A0A3B1D7U4_9ZZZZ
MYPHSHKNIKILSEDNHIIVVVKPFNMPTQADSSHSPDLLSTLKAYLKEKYNKPGNVFLGMVHRLDRPVGGLLVFAKSSKAAARLSNQIRLREFEKEYVAAVEGAITPKSRRLIHFILKDNMKNRVWAFDKEKPNAKKAELEYKKIRAGDETSLLNIRMVTGRKHQIRAQLAAVGSPVVGDVKYGASAPLPGANILLYATRLAFRHPVKKEPIDIRVDPPDDWPI